MLRIAYYSKPGNVRNLERVEEELSPPGPGEVQVRVRAIGINFADVFSTIGLYTAAGWKRFVPGIEYAGVIEAVGTGVTNVRAGDRVMGVTRFGAYATTLNTDARFVMPLPMGWSFEEGAAFPVASMTAYYGLIDQCRLKKGEIVLIHSAAGSVGIMANRIAKKYGCFTIGLVGDAAKADFCTREGYDRVIVRDSNFRESLTQALSGKQLNVVMECTGGRYHRESLRALGKRGRMAVYGFAHYMPKGDRIPYLRTAWRYLMRPRVDVFHFNNISVSSFNLIYLFEAADEIRPMVEEALKLDLGRPVLAETFPFEQLPQALLTLKSGHTKGKVVVTL